MVQADYLPILIFFGLATGLSIVIIAASLLLVMAAPDAVLPLEFCAYHVNRSGR